MTLEKRTSDLIEELLVAQISNIDPLDYKRIMERWRFLIAEAIGKAMDDAMRQGLHDYRKRAAMIENCPVDQCEKRLLTYEIERLRTCNETLRRIVNEYRERTRERLLVERGTVYGDQAIFDAITEAVTPAGPGSFEINVKRFIETFNNHRDRALCMSLNLAQAPTMPPRPDSIYSQFHLDNWTDADFASHAAATRKTIEWLLRLEASGVAQTPKPYGEVLDEMDHEAKHDPALDRSGYDPKAKFNQPTEEPVQPDGFINDYD